jgi:hypothetical protein
MLKAENYQNYYVSETIASDPKERKSLVVLVEVYSKHVKFLVKCKDADDWGEFEDLAEALAYYNICTADGVVGTQLRLLELHVNSGGQLALNPIASYFTGALREVLLAKLPHIQVSLVDVQKSHSNPTPGVGAPSLLVLRIGHGAKGAQTVVSDAAIVSRTRSGEAQKLLEEVADRILAHLKGIVPAKLS